MKIVAVLSSLVILPSQAFVTHKFAYYRTKEHDGGNSYYHKLNHSRVITKATTSLTHAAEVFHLIDTDNSHTICTDELSTLLAKLDIEASGSEVTALAKVLDVNEDGEICEEDFLGWYESVFEDMSVESEIVKNALLNRRTCHEFDTTPVPDSILRNAVEAAISAPNHKLTEPWRFIVLGQETIHKIAKLNASTIADESKKQKKLDRWVSIPGWCIITSKKSDNEIEEEEDFAATCCAVQNFQLSMWADGIGTKWTSGPITRTPEFADLCGIDLDQEKFVGCIWYGFANGGLGSLAINGKKRKKNVADVLSFKE